MMETEVKLQQYLLISEMRDTEIIKLAQVCSAMFSSLHLTNESATAYQIILKNKFSYMKGEKIIQLCSEAAAYPPKDGIKFSPSFLATILRGYEKINQTISHEERVTSQTERMNYRQEFLNDLYSDFNAFVLGNKPTRIRVWQYVAELLVRSGFVNQMPKATDPATRGGMKRIYEIMNVHESFVLDCFRKMIQQDNHVRDFIYGIE